MHEITNIVTVATLLHGYSLSSSEGSLGFCAVYLIETIGHDGAPVRLVFDSGHAGRRRALRAALAARGLRPADVDGVVLSHAHYDHVQNVDMFAPAPLYLQASELERLEQASGAEDALPPWTGAIVGRMPLHPIVDGDVVAPGVTTLALPGHTTGSLGLVVETTMGTGVLTGDAVSTMGSYRSRTCRVVHFSEAAARTSIDRVHAIADVVYPGHDRPFRTRPAPAYLEPITSLDFAQRDPDSAAAAGYSSP